MIQKTFRLFISSTFSDFIKERELLNEKIFYVVKSHCQKYGYDFQLIDLRWGVNTESALNQKTLKICIDEVKRCKSMSPRPNFLVMLGDRYGWIPLPYNIEASEYLKIYNICSKTEREKLDEWYAYDTNALVPEYVILPRKGEFEDESVWNEKEQELRSILISRAEQLNFSEEKMSKYITSATEQEIAEGILKLDKNLIGNAVALFRNEMPIDSENSDKISKLKNQIRQKFELDGCIANLVELNCTQKEYDNLFCKYIIDILIRKIDEEIEILEHTSDNNEAVGISDNLQIYIDNYFFERKCELQMINNYINSNSQQVCCIYGESGSGKTTLLANFLKHLPHFYVCSFYGMNEKSHTIVNAISYICSAIRKKYSLEAENNINILNIAEKFIDTLYMIPKNEKVVIVIDGLDNFYDADDINENIFPAKLPEGVKLILSSADVKYIEKFLVGTKSVIELNSLSREDARQMFLDMMLQKERIISNTKQQQLIDLATYRGSTPLQIKLIVNICSNWHSYDNNMQLEHTAEKNALMYIKNMYLKYGHDKELVINALAFIAASPYGITEDELQMLLFRIASVKQNFGMEDRYNYNKDRLPFVVWSRLFYDLEDCVVIGTYNGHMVIKFAHQIFYKIVNNKFADYIKYAQDLLTEYYAQKPTYIDKDNRIADARKLMNLTALYSLKKQWSKLRELISNMDSADAALKTMHIDDVLNVYRNLIFNSTENTHVAETILSCIIENYNMLSCYRCEFYQCASGCGIIRSEKPILEWEKKSLGNTFSYSFFVPYGSDAEVIWSPEAKKYAVCLGTYIYIYDVTTQEKVTKININSEDDLRHVINQFLWLDENSFAVTVGTHNVQIYSFNNGILAKLHAIQFDSEFSRMLYSDKEKILFISFGKSINAYSIRSGKKLYSINVASFSCTVNGIVFCLSMDETKIYILYERLMKMSEIKEYDIHNGSYCNIYKIKTKNHRYNITSMQHIGENEWLLSSNNIFISIDAKKRKSTYIVPPMAFDIKKAYVFDKYIVCMYSDMFISIDLNKNYQIRGMICTNQPKITYVETLESLSILQGSKMHIISPEKLNTLNKICSSCMISDANPLMSLSTIFKSFYEELYRIITFVANNIMNTMCSGDPTYDLLNLAYGGMKSSDIKLLNRYSATIIETLYNKKTAVAYEEAGVIQIFNQDGEPEWIFDKLNLTISNSILKMEFSKDAEYIYIWRNNSVKVINLNNGKCVLNLNLTYRNALNIFFSQNNQIAIELQDNKVYKFNLSGKHVKYCDKFPHKINSDKTFFGPYSFGIELIDSAKRFMQEGVMPSEWFSENRFYKNGNSIISLKNGHYVIDGINNEFSDYGYDFEYSLQIERINDQTAAMSFLREKNDIMSTVIKITQRYCILITRLTNSVIVFDCKLMKVISAYKHNSQIIGSEYLAKERMIILYSNNSPYQFIIKVGV